MVGVAVVAVAAAHDDMVHQLDVHHLAGLVHTLGQAVVLHAGIGIVARVVMGEDDARRQALDGWAQDHLDVGHCHGGAAAADADTLLDLLGVVEQHDHDFLVVKVIHAGTQVVVGVITAGDLEALFKFLLLITARQLQGGKNFDGLDLADTVVVLHQVVDALAGDEVEFVVVVAQDALAQVNDRLAWRAHPQQDGEQFGSGQAPEAMFLGFLARAVLLRHSLLDIATRQWLVVLFLLHQLRILNY